MPAGLYKRTLDIKKKISESNKGKPPWNKGKKGLQVAWNKGKKGVQTPWNKGKKLSSWSLERRKNFRESIKRKYPNGKPKCELCSKQLYKYRIKKCRDCFNKVNYGTNSPNWKGGITSNNEKIRKSLEYRTWRETILQRDNWTCTLCGQRGGKLNADHIKRFADFPELRFAVDNGRTLCAGCHKNTDTWGNKKQRAAAIIMLIKEGVI